MVKGMSVPDAEQRIMVLRDALMQRKPKPVTPYFANTWENLLQEYGLVSWYLYLVDSLHNGFSVGIPTIVHTFTPLNSAACAENADVFDNIISHKVCTGHYMGPLIKDELEGVIRPFQSSPVSLVPKPHKPGALCLVQDLSFPHNVSIHASINSFLISDNVSCTWGTFRAFSLLCARLPPGSQGAVQDMVETYCSIPLHPSKWARTTIRNRGYDSVIVNINLCFGVTPGTGCYRHIVDMGADIICAHGISPLVKWVDDHVFLWILHEHLNSYNKDHYKLAMKIEEQGG